MKSILIVWRLSCEIIDINLMSIKAYIHDKLAIFFNLVLIFLGIFNILLVVLKIDTSQSAAIIRYNTTLGLAGFEKSSSSALYQFALMPLLIVAVQTVLAWRLHGLKRGLSILALSLGMVAVLFSIVVSSAILSLHR